jgi:hypothetical protein
MIDSIEPISGPVGTSVTINGANFGSISGTVTFNGINAAPGPWTATQIKTTVPKDATSGNVVVHTSDSKDSNGVPFTVDTTKNLAVTLPNGGEILKVGLPYTISWTSTDNIGNIKIEYSVNNGVFQILKAIPAPYPMIYHRNAW